MATTDKKQTKKATPESKKLTQAAFYLANWDRYSSSSELVEHITTLYRSDPNLLLKIVDKKKDLLDNVHCHSDEPEVLAILAKLPNEHLRKTIAKNEATAVETLAELAQDECLEVKEKITANKTTPLEILCSIWTNLVEKRGKLLKNNQEDDVVYFIVKNIVFHPNVNNDLLEEIARVNNTRINGAIIGQKLISDELRKSLFDSLIKSKVSESLFYCFLMRINVTESEMDTLVNTYPDKACIIRAALKKFPETFIPQLVDSSHKTVKLELLHSDQVPLDVIETLRNDEDDEVSESANIIFAWRKSDTLTEEDFYSLLALKSEKIDNILIESESLSADLLHVLVNVRTNASLDVSRLLRNEKLHPKTLILLAKRVLSLPKNSYNYEKETFSIINHPNTNQGVLDLIMAEVKKI